MNKYFDSENYYPDGCPKKCKHCGNHDILSKTEAVDGGVVSEGVYVHVVVSSDDDLEGSHGNLLSEDENLRNWYESMKRSIRESSKYARGCILNERGKTVWEEPLDEYEKRMKLLNKPSPPPPPPMSKYKTSFFGFVDVLVNQDEIDAHRELMDKWREENLK